MSIFWQRKVFKFRKMSCTDPPSQRTWLATQWTAFPKLPSMVTEHPPVAGLEMLMNCMSHHFAGVMEEVQAEAVEQYKEIFAMEYAACPAAGVAAGDHLYRGKWVVPLATPAFRQRFVEFQYVYGNCDAVRRVTDHIFCKRIYPATAVLTHFCHREMGIEEYTTQKNAAPQRVKRTPTY